MIYLSQLILNPASRIAQNESRRPYQLHRTIMRGFSDRRENGNVLHRLDINPYSGVMALLVQSTVKPNWQPLMQVGQGEYLLSPPVWKAVDLSLRDGLVFQFRLVANPTKRLSSGKGNKPGKRIAFYDEADQYKWLQKRAADNGFRLFYIENDKGESIPQVTISNQRKQTSRKKKITIYTVQFNGRLQITNAEKFKTAVQTGIGPAKAFGCGLLSIAPG